MRITYVGFGDFHRYAGMKQLYHFAQEVCRQGHHAQILIAGRAGTVQSLEEPPLAEIIELRFVGPFLTLSVCQKIKDFNPDILHVWTPRHVPALAGLQLQRCTGAKIILDHEDDEDYHARHQRQAWVANWQTGVRRYLVPLVLLKNIVQAWIKPLRADGGAFSWAYDGLTLPLIMKQASAHTAISPNLVEWLRTHCPKTPVHLLYPGANLALFSPDTNGEAMRAKLGLGAHKILVYTGTMNLEVFSWFMQVLLETVKQHASVILILVGEDRFREEAHRVAYSFSLQDHYQLIGQVSYEQIPGYLAMADILLQHPLDLGNEKRLPAKLPEYLAMGKPVVTYAQGIGRSFENSVHVEKISSTDPVEMAKVICSLLSDQAQCKRMGHAARALALERFDWRKNSKSLIEIYRSVLPGDSND